MLLKTSLELIKNPLSTTLRSHIILDFVMAESLRQDYIAVFGRVQRERVTTSNLLVILRSGLGEKVLHI